MKNLKNNITKENISIMTISSKIMASISFLLVMTFSACDTHDHDCHDGHDRDMEEHDEHPQNDRG